MAIYQLGDGTQLFDEHEQPRQLNKEIDYCLIVNGSVVEGKILNLQTFYDRDEILFDLEIDGSYICMLETVSRSSIYTRWKDRCFFFAACSLPSEEIQSLTLDDSALSNDDLVRVSVSATLMLEENFARQFVG